MVPGWMQRQARCPCKEEDDMTLTKAAVTFLVAAILFALAFILDLAAVPTGRVRLMSAGAFFVAVGLMLTQ
jgi:hypothetical protein